MTQKTVSAHLFIVIRQIDPGQEGACIILSSSYYSQE